MCDALKALKAFFSQQCRLRDVADFVMYQHPKLEDCLIIENRESLDLQKLDKQIVVDLPCGMAVLRGANVFSQGILACPHSLKVGDLVSVYSDIDPKCLKGSSGVYQGNKIHVGNGIAQVSRADLFNSTGGVKGVGILMTKPMYEAPSLSDLSFPWVFSQNLPSMAC